MTVDPAQQGAPAGRLALHPAALAERSAPIHRGKVRILEAINETRGGGARWITADAGTVIGWLQGGDTVLIRARYICDGAGRSKAGYRCFRTISACGRDAAGAWIERPSEGGAPERWAIVGDGC